MNRWLVNSYVSSAFCAEEGKFFVDFKNGSGSVGEGEPAENPDVTIKMNKTNFLKIFNRE